MSFQPGRMFQLLWLILIIAVTLWSMRRARTKQVTLRRLPALDAIDEVIGRAVEMNRPVMSHQGSALLSTTVAATTQAALAVLSYVAHQCAKLDCRLIVPSQSYEANPLMEDVVRTAYTAEGVPEKFNIDTVQFLASDGFVFQGAIAGLMARTRPAAYIGIGPMGLEAQTNIMNMARLGGLTIGGAPTGDRMSDMACADYSLFATEVYACGAYLSKDPIQIGSILTMDLVQLAAVATMIVGFILGALKLPWLTSLLKW